MIKLYTRLDDRDNVVLELWGGSTKHPDSVFHFSRFTKNESIAYNCQIYQWILECASRLDFPFHAKELVEFAEMTYLW